MWTVSKKEQVSLAPALLPAALGSKNYLIKDDTHVKSIFTRTRKLQKRKTSEQCQNRVNGNWQPDIGSLVNWPLTSCLLYTFESFILPLLIQVDNFCSDNAYLALYFCGTWTGMRWHGVSWWRTFSFAKILFDSSAKKKMVSKQIWQKTGLTRSGVSPEQAPFAFRSKNNVEPLKSVFQLIVSCANQVFNLSTLSTNQH